MQLLHASKGCRCGWHKLLVVDDSDLRLRAVTLLLRQRIEVLIAATPAEALRVVEREQPRLALLDYGLASDVAPHLIGPLKQLVADMRVVVYSGNLDPGKAEESRAAGAIEAIDLADAYSFDDGLDLLMEGPGASRPSTGRRCSALQQVEDEHIERTLWLCNGNASSAARQLGISRGKLHQWLKDRGKSSSDFTLVDAVQFLNSRSRNDSR